LLGRLLIDDKSLGQAEAALKRACELDKSDDDGLILLGQVQASEGLLDEAIRTYEQSAQVNPHDVRTYLSLGTLMERKDDWKKALEWYQKALQVDPDDPVAANNLAYLMLNHGGNIDVATSLAQTARSRMPESPIAADTLAWAYYKRGTYRPAIDLLKDALKQSPDNPTYHYHLGLVYAKASEKAEARGQFELVLKIAPKFAQADEIRKVLADLGTS